jgi:glucosamine-6-phosphate deaminase
MSSELHVKTVKYFKSIERVQEEVGDAQARRKKLNGVVRQQVGSVE